MITLNLQTDQVRMQHYWATITRKRTKKQRGNLDRILHRYIMGFVKKMTPPVRDALAYQKIPWYPRGWR